MNQQLNMFVPPPPPPPIGTKVTPEHPMEDHWPPFTFTPAVMAAYKRAESADLIRIQKVAISRTTQSAVVRYLAAIPIPEWMHEIFSEYKDGGGKAAD